MNKLELINTLKNECMILTLLPQGRISIQLRCAIKNENKGVASSFLTSSKE